MCWGRCSNLIFETWCEESVATDKAGKFAGTDYPGLNSVLRALGRPWMGFEQRLPYKNIPTINFYIIFLRIII